MLSTLLYALHLPYSIRRMMLKRRLYYDLLFLSISEDMALFSLVGVEASMFCKFVAIIVLVVHWEEGDYSLSTLANLVNMLAYSFFSFSCDSLTTLLQTVT